MCKHVTMRYSQLYLRHGVIPPFVIYNVTLRIAQIKIITHLQLWINSVSWFFVCKNQLNCRHIVLLCRAGCLLTQYGACIQLHARMHTHPCTHTHTHTHKQAHTHITHKHNQPLNNRYTSQDLYNIMYIISM